MEKAELPEPVQSYGNEGAQQEEQLEAWQQKEQLAEHGQEKLQWKEYRGRQVK